MAGWRPDTPAELPDGTICCQAHHRIYCVVCCCDYTSLQPGALEMNDCLDGEHEEVSSDYSDTDSDDGAPVDLKFVDREPGGSYEVIDGLYRNDTPEQVFTDPRATGSADASSDEQSEDQKPIDYTPVERFTPPNNGDTPDQLFTLRSIQRNRMSNGTVRRFIRNTNRRQMLALTDGACSDNGRDGAVGGCAFVFRGNELKPDQVVATAFRLEDRGPTGILYPHTSNRAELRAVIGLLQFRHWGGEGYEELVIATDSEYVEKGATQWISGWVKRGWRTSLKKEVANRDLWDLFFREVQKLRQTSFAPCRVMIWRIPRALNKVADKAAKEEAAKGEAVDRFTPIYGIFQ